MKSTPLFVILLLWQYHLSEARTLTKRFSPCNTCPRENYIVDSWPTQRCPGGNCGSPVITLPQPCRNGQCGNNNNHMQTCSFCINTCSRRCSNNNECLNNCLRYCACEEQVVEPQPQEGNCCEVVHPKHCFVDDYGNKRCMVRKHRECSDLCTSSVVAIQEGDRGRRECHYIRNYPYVYCGNYERQQCGQCLTCDGSYNPERCSLTSGCSDSCRSALVRPN